MAALEEHAMRRRGAIALVVVIAARCISGEAQSASPMTVEAPSPQAGMVVEVGGVLVGPVTGIKGQPYSLVEKTTQVRTLADGTNMTTHDEQRRMRDSEGRVSRGDWNN